ncbi:leucyl aminopeptidase [Mesoplasma entomophilum]|uniref:Probable cytosol aminopeptidase n=1 Tax=Mesoplasma entomophilum TaxID=2149 RepID=A0A3S5XYJ8_9MOLU|nr:leucyl aminopeptidase family protein [Mesoplasma entomophilum]ATQ35235.1 peptidase M17 [Mesoplasma entomophilum]ATZ19183.1 leucyl aminopeptidase [Mesoplasma entomophilum]
MITINNNNLEYKLVAVRNNKINKDICDKPGSITFISESKTYYLVIKKDTMSYLRQLKLGLSDFVKNIKADTNIDFKSIIEIINDVEKEIIFNVICDVISFESHNFITYKKDIKNINHTINIDCSDEMKNLLDENILKNKYVNYARDLQDFPPNIGTSDFYGEKLLNDASKIEGLKVTVLKNKELKDLEMNLVLAVNQGSNHEANVVVLEYNNNPNGEKVALIGKGICFDTGGYDLKPSMFIEGMKFDMTGAAIVMSIAMALAEAKAKINFVAVGLFTDNKIGQKAVLPESIIKSKNGLTVEINNTDAEGRLVLADGITYAIREKNADVVYDIATLTGATAMALGESASGVFTEFDEMWNKLSEASNYTAERFWRLPVFDEHKEQVQNDSVLADLTNSCNKGPGGSTAAAFLTFFAEDKKFLHIDCSRVVRVGLKGQGYIVKTMFELLKK